MLPYHDEKTDDLQLYRKYRPRTTCEILGNEDIVAEIDNIHKAFRKGKPIPHSYLFHGPPGCCKTTGSRVLALGLTTEPWHSIVECNSADYGLDLVREIARLQILGCFGGCRLFLLDECHRMTKHAQEAFLKLLEEPSRRSYFVLATTKPQALLETLIQRCLEFKVRPLNKAQSYELVKRVCKGERKTLPREVVDRIVAISNGVPRVILQHLERAFLHY